jgi:16S rRNA (cytosine1402-N4)-methyltransferase
MSLSAFDSPALRADTPMMAARALGHVPVLPAEVLAALSPRAGETYLDCTAGLGGHAALIAPLLGASGTIVLNDLDASNLARAKERIEALAAASDAEASLPPIGIPRVVTIHANFAEAPRRMAEMGLSADMVLADLGFASTQVDDAARGFSFMRDGPLDMRLDPSPGKPTAADLVNTLSERELADILHEFGEERAARLVSAKIVASRKDGPISTTSRLAEIVRSVVRSPHFGIDPATRTFQALRIAVNDEMGSLRALLDSVSRAASRRGSSGGGGATPLWLAAGSRVALISFHSLEDRPVKQAFADLMQRDLARAIGKKPTEATDEERANNPRSRSAKLRAIQIL